MASKQITDLTERAYGFLAATDVVAVESAAGTTYKGELQDLKQYFLDNHTVGGTSSGDIVDIDTAQDLENKDLGTGCTINSGNALTVTSTELNALDGVTSNYNDLNLVSGLAAAGLTSTELGYVNGVTSAIQTQINAISTAQGPLKRTYTYYLSFTTGAGETTKQVTHAMVDTLLSLPAGYYANHLSVNPTLYSDDGGAAYSLLPWGETYSIKTHGTTTSMGGAGYRLDYVEVSGLTASTSYVITFTFGLVASLA